MGRLVASVADYETVRELVNDMYIDSNTGASSDVRALVKVVKELDAIRGDGERITNTILAKHLRTGIKQVTRRAKRAIKLGWLVNREQRKSYPADYAPGEPMPEIEGLPLLGVDRVDTASTNEGVHDFSFKKGRVDMLTPLTDGNNPPTPPADSSVSMVSNARCSMVSAILGMTIEQTLDVWRSEGAPVIHLGPGENCFDLATLLSYPDLLPRHLETVKTWLCGVLEKKSNAEQKTK